MSFLETVLFESPIWLGSACFVAFAAVLLLRNRLSERGRMWALPAVLLATVGLFVMQMAVRTDRERIHDALDAFVAAIEARDGAGIDIAIGADYHADRMDHAAMVKFITEALERVDIHDTRLRQRDIAVDGDRARMDLGAVATVRIRGGAGDFHVSHWRLDWANETAGWRIVSIRPIDIDTIHFQTLQQVRGQIP